MATVKVFTPNFKHITVKISPNMTLLQILEEASLKAELNANEHDLKHHRTILDMSQIFRFSGLPANCELEMVPTRNGPRKDIDQNDVGIVLQTEARGRLEGTFKPGNTLLEIITQLCPDEADLSSNPVIIYMRSDVQGTQLAEVTLKSLGLTSGKGLLRLIHKSAEELKTQANVSSSLPVKPAKPEDDKSPPRRELKRENNLIAAAAASTTKEDQPSPVDSAVPGASKDVMVSEPMKVAESVPSKRDPPVKRNIEFTKEDLERIEKETHLLDDHKTVIYSLESVVCSPSDEIPDSFFDVTVHDIRVLFSQLRDSNKSMENAPLMTSKLRELEDSKRVLNQLSYKETLIRIQFPNRMVLQTVFKPITQISDVKQFLRRFICEEIEEFELFTTPPKTILQDEQRLVELHCVPQALIHFGYSGASTTNVIKTEFLEKLSTSPAADFLAAKLRGRIEMTEGSTSSQSCTEEPMDESESGAATTDSSEPKKRIVGTFKVSSTVTTEKAGLPKWFKTSK